MCMLGRYCLRDHVRRILVDKHKFLMALASVIQSQPYKATDLDPPLNSEHMTCRHATDLLHVSSGQSAALICAAEIPLSVKNYPWSITDASMWVLISAQVIFQTPACALTVYIGATASDLAGMASGDEEMPPAEIAGTIAGIVFAVVAIAIIGVYTKRELDNLIEAEANRNEIRMGGNSIATTRPPKLQLDSDPELETQAEFEVQSPTEVSQGAV